MFIISLLTWPLTYRYSSLGIDREATDGQTVRATYYRVRWPGNGSVLVGRIDQHHRDRGKPVDGFDLGGVFLRPAQVVPPRSAWNWLGFWWIDVDRTLGERSEAAPHSDRAVMLGVPHWLLVVLAGGLALLPWRRRSRRETGNGVRTGETSPLSPAGRGQG